MLVPDRDGNMADVILGYDDLASYQVNTPHFGAPIGRNANRIGNAVITIDGKDYKLEQTMALTTCTVVRICITAVYGKAGHMRQQKAAAWTSS